MTSENFKNIKHEAFANLGSLISSGSDAEDCGIVLNIKSLDQSVSAMG